MSKYSQFPPIQLPDLEFNSCAFVQRESIINLMNNSYCKPIDSVFFSNKVISVNMETRSTPNIFWLLDESNS